MRTINLPGHATTLEDMRRCSWQDWLNAAKEAFREMKEQYRFVSVTGLSMGGCLTLMIAESRTEEKDVMTKVVVNLINKNN